MAPKLGLSPKAKLALIIVLVIAASYAAGFLYLHPIGQAGAPRPAPLYQQPQRAAPTGPAVPAKAESGSPATGGTATSSGDIEPPSRMITYTAEVSLESPDVQEAARRVEDVAKTLGGYVAWERVTLGEKPRAVVAIKVPADRYGEALEQIKSIGRLVSVSQNAQDVTNQYIDLQARLRNLKAEEQRLLELLGKARSVGEVLQVEDRLSRVRSQIEYLEALMKNLQRRIDYATITVTITAPTRQALPGPDWGSILRDAVYTAYTVIAGLVILTLGLSPLWAIIGVAYIAYRHWRRRGPAAEAQK